uniref:MHC class I antigen n=1 Tax=Plectus sambesii TaxID=2011161 RepID=A0A914VBZ7_9BILA
VHVVRAECRWRINPTPTKSPMQQERDRCYDTPIGQQLADRTVARAVKNALT